MNRLLASLAALTLVAMASAARAQTGVSSDRVSLPDGPGSLEGVGGNVGVNRNMGLMSYQVPVEVPEGFPGLTPELAFSYSSGSGNSVLGMGWSLDSPSIERMTSRGVPHYALNDLFAADGSSELVQISSSPPTYRARCEGGFVRYSWLDSGSGAEGYFKAEYPDGRIGFFGADSQGHLVPSARVAGAGGTFRYLLVETLDLRGHALRYSYDSLGGNVPLLSALFYVHDASGSPRFRVALSYEGREDKLSDAKPGIEQLIQHRLASLDVFSGSQRLRSYRLSYENYDLSGGRTRLMKIEQRGLQDGLNPIAFSFEYSQALGATCSGVGCGSPFLVTMGSLGVNLASRKATLLDLNGDSLPDVVDSSNASGPHRIFLSRLAPDGSHSFAPALESSVGRSSGHPLDSHSVQPLDVDGDGFTDLVNTKTKQVLRNRGQGDWSEAYSISVSSELGDLVDLNFDDEDSTPGNVRFLDFDNDRRIDILQASQSATQLYANAGGLGFNSVSTSPLAWAFDSDQLDLADMNGDGLLDPVNVTRDSVSYRLNLGNGSWGPAVTIDFPSSDPSLVQLEDINGDSLADLVVVQANTVRFALNRNGNAFLPAQSISEAGGFSLPDRSADPAMSVLFADMNGNGSDDVVWIDGSGLVTYLELFPVRPHLLTRIQNALGAITTVAYSTSVEQAARDAAAGNPWANKLPHSMVVVSRTDAWDELTEVHELIDFAYHDAFYDGVEKAFRGFGHVEQFIEGDSSQESGRLVERFELGSDNSCRHGLLVSTESFSEDQALSLAESTYEDCSLDGIPATTPPVRFVCKTAERHLLKEAAPESSWAETRTEYAYDGYGNLSLTSQLGVTSIGAASCPACSDDSFGVPCGPSCIGDESFSESLFVPPSATGGKWILNKPYRERGWGKDGSTRYRETLTYYDGEAFLGLPSGQLTLGEVSRVTQRVDETGTTIDSQRLRHDGHGNVVESLSPNASLSGTSHREKLEYDAWGLKLVRRDVVLADHSLRQEYKYDPTWALVSEATSTMLVLNGESASPRNSRFFGYDEFGRQSYSVLPGDSVQSPSETFTYELTSPVSRVIRRQRSQVGGPLGIESYRCFDGKGRLVQTRTRLADGKYHVDGFLARNRRGEIVRSWQPYTSSSAACDSTPPEGVLFTESRFDSIGRLRRVTLPDSDLHSGVASFSETVYLPLAKQLFDPEDTDSSSPHANTPTTSRENGLGQVTQIERLFAPGGAPAVLSAGYDEHGNLTLVTDAAGHTKRQTYDLVGRLVKVEDPNSGTTTFAYDNAGNLISKSDARGITVRTKYDAANRALETWDDAARNATLVASHYDRSSLCPAAQCTNTAGRLAAVTYPLAGLPGGASNGADLFAYDVRGQLKSSKRNLDGIAFELGFTYDNAGRVTGRSFPDGRNLSFGYDDASRLTAVDSIVDAVTYGSRGELTQVTLHNGVSTQWTWDNLIRLASAETKGSASTLQSLGYTRDRAGNLLAIDDRAKPAGTPDASAQLAYDAAYRLLTAKLGADAESLTFAYDAIDNLTSLTSSLPGSPAHLGTYSYDAAHPNAVASAGSLAMSYDAAGNLLSRGALAFGWDHLGRLVSTSGESALVADAYGPGPDRLMHVSGDSLAFYPDRDFEVRDGISSVYVRVGGSRVARLESASMAATVYSDLAPSGAPDGRIDAADAWLAYAGKAGLVPQTAAASEHGALLLSAARRALLEARGEAVYLTADHLGSITLATDASGALLGRRSYYPNGLVRGDDDLGAGPYGFTGQELQEESRLLHFQHRFLDPTTMRWASVDPLFNALSSKLLGKLGESTTAYAYVANNPENHVDPTGLGKDGPKQALMDKKFNELNAKFSGKTFKTVDAAKAYFAKKTNGSSFSFHAHVETTTGGKFVLAGLTTKSNTLSFTQTSRGVAVVGHQGSQPETDGVTQALSAAFAAMRAEAAPAPQAFAAPAPEQAQPLIARNRPTRLLGGARDDAYKKE